MRFVNKTDKDLSFDLAGRPHKVPAGGHCEVPEQFVYAVKLYGLPLEAVEQPAAEEQETAQPRPPKAKVSKRAAEPSEDELLDELTRPDPKK